MTQILLVAGSIPSEDLEILAEQIRQENDLTVDIHTVPQHGYGVTWVEFLEIYVSPAASYVADKFGDETVGYVVGKLVEAVINHVKRWHQDLRAKKPGTARPFSLTIRHKEGRVLRAFEIDVSGKIDDVTDKKGEQPLKPLPKPVDAKSLSPRGPQYDSDYINGLSKKKCQITVIYCDILDSSSLLFSERTGVRDFMVDYQRVWCQVIAKYSGGLLSLHRDNVTAFFEDTAGESNGAERTAFAALEILHASRQFQAESEYLDLSIKIRIGMATGLQSPAGLVADLNSRSSRRTIIQIAAGLSMIDNNEFVAVQPKTRELLKAKFALEELEGKRALGMGKIVEAWRLIGLQE